jgi:hypothetical protein
METLSKCMDKDTIDTFCGCIANEKAEESAATAFCNRAKNDKNISGEDLAELKIALLDIEDDSCCEC